MIIIAERKRSGEEIKKHLKRKKINKLLIKLLYGFILLNFSIFIGYIVFQ
tara:strand:- start:2344 stop:2493 length:150 start_codon:yes stop_codon:yes gene_type:complete